MRVFVNYIRRYLPSVSYWRKKVISGDLGSFLHGNIVYGKGLLSNGSHFVNLAEAWLGPLAFHSISHQLCSCYKYDSESHITLTANMHSDSPLFVRSVGHSGLRAGELDLWFENGRLSWLNNGQAIAYWPVPEHSCPGDYLSLAVMPEITPTGIAHYQHEVLDAIHEYSLTGFSSRLGCTLSEAFQTLQVLSSSMINSNSLSSANLAINGGAATIDHRFPPYRSLGQEEIDAANKC